MSWPVPTPDELRDQAETDMEEALSGVSDKNGQSVAARVISAAVRGGKTVLSVICRIIAMALYPLHLHLRWWGDQYFPDTANDENLERHAATWGVWRLSATAASGDIHLAGGVPGAIIPTGLEYKSASGLCRTVTGGVIDGSGEAVLSVRALTTGVAGNLAGNAPLTLTTTIAGLPDKALTGVDGLTGGADKETNAGLLKRLLETIREPGHGGNNDDYRKWAKISADVAYVKVYGDWTGRGSVGIVVAMAGPRAPSPAELAAILAAIKAVAPVTVTQITVLPAIIKAIDLKISVSPDTASVRAAIAKSAALYFKTDAAIGGSIWPSRLSEMISAADGEYAHILIDPAAVIACAKTEIPALGAITWSAAP